MRRFGESNERLTTVQTRARGNGRLFCANPAAVFLAAAWQSGSSSAVTAGTIVAFTTLPARLFWPVGELLWYAVELRSSAAMFKRIFGYLDLESELADAPGARALRPQELRGEIEFDALLPLFRRRGLDAEEIDLRIEAGQLAALVRPTGADKTTLFAAGRLEARCEDGLVLSSGEIVRTGS